MWYGRWIWILFTDAGPDWPRLKIKTWLHNIWSPGNSTANSGWTELHRTVAHDCTHRFGFRVSKENRMRGRTGHICPKMSNVHLGKQDWDSGILQGLCVPFSHSESLYGFCTTCYSWFWVTHLMKRHDLENTSDMLKHDRFTHLHSHRMCSCVNTDRAQRN